ncbi:MAG: helix-turn-helix domain-containing protein [Candidatus Levybacteria bacterium]|nr:helix-turn-helix domain-containing protein [Candidatus Levybacteria bacterium]
MSTKNGSDTSRTQLSHEARLASRAKRARLAGALASLAARRAKRARLAGALASLAARRAKRAVTLSRAAKQRLKWMEHFGKFRNARLTCRHFGISPDTFYLWRRRFNPENLKSLEDDFRTRKPRKTRFSKHQQAQLETVKKLKDVNPRLGKVRIAKILREMGYKISPSTITRLLKLLQGDALQKLADSLTSMKKKRKLNVHIKHKLI